MLVGMEHYYNGEYDKALAYVSPLQSHDHHMIIHRLLQDIVMRYQLERWPVILAEVLTMMLR